MSEWINVIDEKPCCNMEEGSLGVEVFVKYKSGLVQDAFYGCRIKKDPCFYIFGVELVDVTHWKYTNYI